MHVYEVRPRKDHRGADLISDRAAIDYSYTLYDSQRFVIECPAPSMTIFLAMKNSIIFISAFSLRGDDAGLVQCLGTRRDGNNRRNETD